MRENVEGRPLLLLGAGLVVGLTGLLHPVNFLFLLPFLWLARKTSQRVLVLVGVAGGLLLTPAPLSSILDRRWVSGSGVVSSVPRNGNSGTRFNAEIGSVGWQVEARDCPSLSMGDQISVTGVGLPLREGGEAFLVLHGVTGRLVARNISVSKTNALWRFAGSWRTSFEQLCDQSLPTDAAGLVKALCFDMSGELPRRTTDLLKDTGTIHIVSASGLHVFVIALAVMWGLSRLPIPRWLQVVIATGILLLYAGATGLNAPVVRAVLMWTVGYSAYIFRRERDALSALLLAGIVYLLWQPRQIYDIGFQLSFVTVGGLILFVHPPARAMPRILEWTYEGVMAAWVAFAASAPLVAYHFGTVSISSIPCNLLVGVAASIVIVSAFVGHLVGLAWSGLGGFLLGWIAGSFAGWILVAVEGLGRQPWASVSVPGFSAYWLPVVYGLFLMTWRQRIVQP